MNPAQHTRLEKESHPERFCVNKRCLWREETQLGLYPCPKHSATGRLFHKGEEAALNDAIDAHNTRSE